MSISRAIATVGSLTLLSRLAGFGRDILTAALLGAGPLGDAFFVALKLPNLFRRTVAEGALTVTLVPLHADAMRHNGKGGADRFAGETLTLLALLLSAMTAVAVLATPWLMPVLAPGFSATPATFNLAVDLTRLTLPYLPLIAIVALLGGLLNALDRFGPLAAAPIVFNLTLIAALIMATPLGLSPAHSMAAGVSLSGLIQLLWLGWHCHGAGCLPRFRWPQADGWSPWTRRFLRQSIPAAIGAGAAQLTLFLNVVLASFLPAGGISSLYYADRLQQMPLGIIGIAIGTALLPTLSRQIAAGLPDQARHTLSRALVLCLLLALPAAVALGVAGQTIIMVLFERGAFDAAATRTTATALAGYAIGIPAFVAWKALAASRFARHDSRAPLAAALLTAAFMTALAVMLIPANGAAGIAIATGCAAWIGCGWLAFAEWRDSGGLGDRALIDKAIRIALSAAGMALVLVLLKGVLEPWLLAGSTTSRIAALLVLVVSGALAYGLLVFTLKAARFRDLKVLAGGKN